MRCLTFKAPSISTSVTYKTLTFSEKTKFGILFELSANQTIHLKFQALFYLKKENKNS